MSKIVGGRRALAGAGDVDQVGRDQRAEEQALRADQAPDRQLVVGQAQAGRVLVGSSLPGQRRRSCRWSAVVAISGVSSALGSSTQPNRPPSRISPPTASSTTCVVPPAMTPQPMIGMPIGRDQRVVRGARACGCRARPRGPGRAPAASGRGVAASAGLVGSWSGEAPAGTRTGGRSPSPTYLRCQNSSRAVTIGHLVEVVRRRRRGGQPLDGAGVPRVGAGDLAVAQRCVTMLTMNTRMPQRDDERADGLDHVPEVPAHAVGVGVDASRHAPQAEDVHRAEGQVEADEHQRRSASCRGARSASGRSPSGTRSRCRRTGRRSRRRTARSGSAPRCSTCRSAGSRAARSRASRPTDHRW